MMMMMMMMMVVVVVVVDWWCRYKVVIDAPVAPAADQSDIIKSKVVQKCLERRFFNNHSS